MHNACIEIQSQSTLEWCWQGKVEPLCWFLDHLNTKKAITMLCFCHLFYCFWSSWSHNEECRVWITFCSVTRWPVRLFTRSATLSGRTTRRGVQSVFPNLRSENRHFSQQRRWGGGGAASQQKAQINKPNENNAVLCFATQA